MRFSKFAHCPCLEQSYASGFDFCLEVIFTSNSAAGLAAKHRDLAGVGERVCDGALQKLLGRVAKGSG